MFLTELKKQTFADIDFSDFSSFISEVNHVFVEQKHNTSVVVVEKEVDVIDINGIGILQDLPRLVFIDEECGNLKVFVDGEELAINTNKNKKLGILQVFRCALCHKCYRRECFVNKHVEYCNSVR